MEDNAIIKVNNVTMQFNLEEEKTDTLKEYILKFVTGKLHFNAFYALKDVSFTVGRGESVALVGLNGSGKSTLLKVIAGVLTPTEGTVSIGGTVAPLIELGAGFDMDLTGRENIYLNGAVLGYSRKFVEERFNEIIDFAELWDFVDVPVKNYSSGMVARLGFSVATLVKADILIVDEVLAVGDYKFQQKCKARMRELLDGGTTLLFVSHDAEQVRELCRKAVWLDHGRVMACGPTEDVLAQYRQFNQA